MRILHTLALAMMLAVVPRATLAAEVPDDGIAQDDLDELLGSDDDISAPINEREPDQGVTTEQVELPPAKKKLIKVLQRKNFMKLGRFEATPNIGLVTNDPFIRRILFGVDLGYHVTEIFAIELRGAFSPNLGDGDHKAITKQIIGANQVTPEISRMMWYSTMNFSYSPLYGKIAVPGGGDPIIFDIYGTFGLGIVGTLDDLELIQKEDDPLAIATASQVHPALSFGGGLRVAFNKTFALRFEARSMSYIGVLESTRLELKNNILLSLGASIFFGRRVE